MAESGVGLENLILTVDPVDVLADGVEWHWFEEAKLSAILAKGIISPKFAKRINPEDYSTTLHNDIDEVYSLPAGEAYGDTMHKVAIAFRPRVKDEKTKYARINKRRIPPSNFLGVVVPDDEKGFAAYAKTSAGNLIHEVLPKVQEKISSTIEKMKEGGGHQIFVYGTSGKCYWPQEFSYEEILELKQK